MRSYSTRMLMRILPAVLIGFLLLFSGCGKNYVKIAQDGNESTSRAFAIRQVTDQSVLISIATEDSDSSIRRAAIVNLTDQPTLIQIASHDNDEIVRAHAANKINDQAVLVNIADKDSSTHVRGIAIGRIVDEESLVKIASIAITPEEREAALDKLHNQESYLKVALESKYGQIRRLALRKISDEALLVKYLFEHGDDPRSKYSQKIPTQKALIHKITNQALLEKIFSHQYFDAGVRGVAISKLENVEFLKNVVADESESFYIRRVALEGIDEQEFLIKIINDAEDIEYKTTALDNLTDQPSLLAIAENHNNARIRARATKKLNDQNNISSIAIRDTDEEVRKTAFSLLTDPQAIAVVALHGQHWMTRSVAVTKLTEREMLEKIIHTDKNPYVKSTAKAKYHITSATSGDKHHNSEAISREDLLLLDLMPQFINIPHIRSERLFEITYEKVVRSLTNSKVAEIVGGIVFINIQWEETNKKYLPADKDKKFKYIEGEKFSLAFKVSTLDDPIEGSWTTAFPYYYYESQPDFIKANIDVSTLLKPVFNTLSQTTLTQIAFNNKYADVRKAAVSVLKDVSILNEIRSKDKDSSVVKSTDERLKSLANSGE